MNLEIKMLRISKNILICMLALTATSCNNATPQTQNPLLAKSATCPDKPVESLSASDIKNITLSEKALKESGSVGAGKMKGFTFKAKSGQQLTYKTTDNLCIWVFAQDNQLVTGKTLNTDGNYTLQITVPQGTTTFELEMSLASKVAEVPKVVASPTAIASPAQNQTVAKTIAPSPALVPQSQPVVSSPAIAKTKDQQIDEIADRLFNEKYPELGGRKIQASEANLQAEWSQIRRCDAVVDFVFFQNNPQMQGRKISPDQTSLVNQWWSIRESVSGCN